MKNTFSFIKDRLKGILKLRSSFIQSFLRRENSFREVNQCSANSFLMVEKGINFRENICQGSRRHSPTHLVLISRIFRFSLNEMKLSSKSFRQPEETRGFSVVALEKSFISGVRKCFVFLNVQATLSIDKSCKISEIIQGWYDGIPYRLKVFFDRVSNQTILFFKNFHFINKMNVFFSRIRISKIFKDNEFLFPFNKEIRNSKYFCDVIPSNCISMDKFVGFFSPRCFSRDRSTKLLSKPLQVFDFSRIYNNLRSKTCSVFGVIFSNGKASITIDVTSCISKISRIYHTAKCSMLGCLSQQVTVLDNPGFLTRSDVDSVIKGLRSANAKFIMDSIDGEDKFGKCAELKSSLIDLECLAA